MKAECLHQIRAGRLLPVVIIEDPGLVLNLADVLMNVGLRVIEITFRTAAAGQAIEMLAAKRPEMLVGAGTLLTETSVKQAVDAGAKFGVSPGLAEQTLVAAQNASLDFVPGVFTPTEVGRALELGCRLLKFFPAEQAGGVKMLTALEGPYAHTGVKFLPTGGIGIGNMKSYLELKSVVAVGGSWFVDKEMIAARNWKGIELLTREALALAR